MSEQVHAIREAAYGEGFDAAVAASAEARDILRERITELEAALRSIYAAADAATCADDWVERISAVMTDDIRALIFKD